MSKTELDSILLVNLYFTGCKLQKPNCPRTELVRKYLSKKINKALVEKRTTYSGFSRKAFIILGILLILVNY
jgi:hypothetical protein